MGKGFKYKNGLVLGKLYPFTLGHAHLIDSALLHSETVHVMVCCLEREKIKPIDRFLMVANHYKNNDRVRVHLCNDENPQYPNECSSLDEFYNNYWVPTVRNCIESLDVVFTSEAYGDEFAEYLGIDHMLIDIDRATVPISGTQVRGDLNKNFNFLPKSTQKYFQKNICIVGPESTGKSTLVKKLATHFDSPYVEEYGRTYVESITTDMLTEWDFEVIATNHHRLCEKAIKENDNMFLFIDTDAIITKTFKYMYLGSTRNDKIDEIVNAQNFDLYILMTPTVAWVDDGTRDFSEEDKRNEHFELIKTFLTINNKNFVIIEGKSYDYRFNEAVQKINDLFGNI